ncbi:MAG TPA: hypothetical protein VMF30_01430 [Pirellulales bacterium]|nr:hypothetical protein [Pirellulales bacterium]
MLRHSLKAALVIVALACLIQDAQATNHARRRAAVSYWLGGFGPGPFGHGNFVYAGQSTYNYQARMRRGH